MGDDSQKAAGGDAPTSHSGTSRARMIPGALVLALIIGTFGYAVGDIGVGVIIGVAAVVALFLGLFLPPLAPASESAILRLVRRARNRGGDKS